MSLLCLLGTAACVTDAAPSISSTPEPSSKETPMPYELPSLPYDYNALEPTIDARTMEIHHGKHHQAYVDNLNKALEGTPWADRDVLDVIQNLDAIPEDKRAAVRNNG